MATRIYNVNQLQDMALDLTIDYELGKEIDASATVEWNGGLGFEPIGDLPNPFTGSLDGKGHRITGLHINRPATNRLALIGRTGIGGAVLNVIMVNCDIIGDWAPIGSLVAENDGSIANSYAMGSVIDGKGGVGGLAGHNNGLIVKCFAMGSITGSVFVGGLVGSNLNSIVKSYADVNVIADSYLGGLVGTNAIQAGMKGSMVNCFARGSVTGDDRVGGLLGYNNSDTTLSVANSYSTGLVTGNTDVGGLVGENTIGCPVTNSFWDKQTSGQDASDGGIGKLTAQMKSIHTFLAAGWTISRIWSIDKACNNGYPCLVGVNTCCPPSIMPVADPSIVGKKVSLEAIRNIEMMNTGRFYINKEGKAVYESRFHRGT